MRSGTRPAAPARVEALSSDLSEGSVDRPGVLVALVSTLIALGVFLLLQGILAAYNLNVIRDAVDRGMLELSPDGWSPVSALLTSSIAGMISFVTFAIAGSVIAGRGQRFTFALPAVAYVFASAVASPHHPEALGSQWGLECFSNDLHCAVPWFGHAWLGPTVDLALVVIPGCVVARRVRSLRWPEPRDAAAAAAILTCTAAVSTAAWAMLVIQNHVDVRALVAVGALGLLTGTPRPWWPWFHVVFALAMAQTFAWLLDFILWPEPTYPLSAALPYLLGETWPIVAVGLIASAWEPLAWVIRKLQERPLRLAIAVNVLNLVDAVMTLVAVGSGGAYESNPFVRLAGLPMKIVVVGGFTWLLYRRRPSALVWPFAALVWVAGYHVAGIFVNGWR